LAPTRAIGKPVALDASADEREYAGAAEVTPELLRRKKRAGFGDRQLADLRGERESDVRERRWGWGFRPTYKVVDTCAG
jgi:carbamoyl-phosphate synthase large subunit